MPQSSLLEEYLNSPNQLPIPLAEFQLQAPKLHALFEAPVRHVSRHRNGVHEYILLYCQVKVPGTQKTCIVYFRLERNPSQKGVRVLTGKPNQAADTVRMNLNLESLHQDCESRGYFVFNPEDDPPKTLMLKHILEIYDFLARGSSNYSLLGTNCRWLCYGLLECLRDCVPCYRGHWMGTKPGSVNRTHDNQAAVQAKNNYLREKHPGCCCPLVARSSSVLETLVAEAATLGAAAANFTQIANQAQMMQGANFPDSNVIYATTGPTTPIAELTGLPATTTAAGATELQTPVPPVQSHSRAVPSYAEQPNIFHDGAPTGPSPYPRHDPHAYTRQRTSHTSLRPTSVSSQLSLNAHIPYHGHGIDPTYHGGANNGGGSYHSVSQEWDNPSDFCSCVECMPHEHRPRSISSQSFQPHPQRGYPQSHGPPIHPSPNMGRHRSQHMHSFESRAAPNMSPLYIIPETPPYAAPQNHWQPQGGHMHHPGPISGGCAQCGNHPAAPPPRHQSTNARVPSFSNHTHARPPSDGSMNPSYFNNAAPPPVYNGQQQPHPTWWPEDSWHPQSAEPPTRTESPTPLSQRTMDDMSFNGQQSVGGFMEMPDPNNYRSSLL